MKRARSESVRPTLDIASLQTLLSMIAPGEPSIFDVGGNPLGPCGACNEWLKKIYEVNPDFRVVTFTDLTCMYLYVREVF